MYVFVYSKNRGWSEAIRILELDNGAAWRLIFTLLARGRLYDEDKEAPLRVRGRSLVRSFSVLFDDTVVRKAPPSLLQKEQEAEEE